MESKLKCDICGNPLIPNNIGKIIKKETSNRDITICKACKEPKRRNKEKRGRGRPPASTQDIF